MSTFRDAETRDLCEAQRISEVIDGHRVQAHRTTSIPEKVRLIAAMIELRRTQRHSAPVLVEPKD